MKVPSEAKFKWRKSEYYLLEDKKTGITYIRRRGDVIETEITRLSDEKDTLLFDLLSMDVNKSEDILNFCNKYGRLGIASISNFETGYQRIYFHSDEDGEMPPDYPDNLGLTHPYQAPETIKSYKIYIQIIKAILALQEAVQTKNYAKICDRALFLLSTFEGFTTVPDALFDLDNDILNECRKHVTWPEALGVDLDAIYEPGSRYTFDFEPWLTGELSYENCFSLDAFVNQWSQTDLEDMVYYSQCVSARVINSKIHSIRFILEVTPSGQLQDGWSADSLNAIVYYILYMKISQGTMIRKCANRTCKNHFEIRGNDTRKIYCSAECAKLEAKRKQRAREKEKKAMKSKKD